MKLVAPWHPLTILLVVDDPVSSSDVTTMVHEGLSDARVVHVRTLADAEAALVDAQPDCVLLDLLLPDGAMNAVEKMRALDPAVPLIALTDIDDEHFGVLAVSSGAQDYLVEQRMDGEILRRAVMYAIERKRSELATVALETSRLRAEENTRLERGLLGSPRLLDRPGIDVVSTYRPSRAGALLGGAFYDVVQTPDRTVHVVIGDVSGHDADAAALGVALRIGWRTLTASGVHGSARMRHLEWLLRAERSGPGIFATALTLSIDPADGRVTVVRAGHPGFLQHSATDVSWVNTRSGPALGLGVGTWPEEEFVLDDRVGLVLLTDGLFEGLCGDGNRRLGEEGLLRIAVAEAGRLDLAFVEALIAGVERLAHAQGGLDDDIAVVRVQRTPPEFGGATEMGNCSFD